MTHLPPNQGPPLRALGQASWEGLALRWAASRSPRRAGKLRRVPAGVPDSSEPGHGGGGALAVPPPHSPLRHRPQSRSGLTKSPNETSAYSRILAPRTGGPCAHPRLGRYRQGSREIRSRPGPSSRCSPNRSEILGCDTEFQGKPAALLAHYPLLPCPFGILEHRGGRPSPGRGWFWPSTGRRAGDPALPPLARAAHRAAGPTPSRGPRASPAHAHSQDCRVALPLFLSPPLLSLPPFLVPSFSIQFMLRESQFFWLY